MQMISAICQIQEKLLFKSVLVKLQWSVSTVPIICIRLFLDLFTKYCLECDFK